MYRHKKEKTAPFRRVILTLPVEPGAGYLDLHTSTTGQLTIAIKIGGKEMTLPFSAYGTHTYQEGEILITYDQPADLASATNISNYWIRSNMNTPQVFPVSVWVK
jgi:hypothetical protein